MRWDRALEEVQVQEAMHRITECLAEKGFENPSLDVELLLSWILSCRRIDLHLDPHRSLTPQERAALQRVVERRLSHATLQYIVGSTQFLSFDLIVNEHVFIPRPETEILVEVVMKRLRPLSSDKNALVIVDLGTGSGNIAVALAHAFPTASVYATDLSREALAVARRNVGLATNVCFLQGDVCEPLERLGLRGSVDAIVSNPPYIPTSEIEGLAPEIRDHEPRLALDGGEDGLDLLRKIVPQAHPFLNRRGFLAVEVGQGQAERVREMMAGSYEEIDIFRDVSGIERIVMGRKKGERSG